jgi:hypothetical protein
MEGIEIQSYSVLSSTFESATYGKYSPEVPRFSLSLVLRVFARPIVGVSIAMVITVLLERLGSVFPCVILIKP